MFNNPNQPGEPVIWGVTGAAPRLHMELGS